MDSVLYIFAGKRKQDEQKYKDHLMPDTYLVGLNRLHEHGIRATYIENSVSERLRKISFNFANIPSLFSAKSFDIVFSGSTPGLIFLNKFLMRNKNTKWVIYNTFLTNMLKRHSSGFKHWILNKSIQGARAVINPSTPQRDFLVEQGYDPSRMHYLPYGIDKGFIDRNLGKPRLIQKPYIMSAGKDMGRDYQTLIDSVRGMDIDLYIGASKRNFADVKNIPDNVHIDFIAPTDLVNYYEHAEFIVIPTFHEDHLDASDCSGQYVLLESMMASKAVIASDRTTIYDYVTPNENAILVEPENTEKLSNAMQDLLNNPDKARELGRSARTKAEQNFTSEQFSRNLADIFKKI